ncbi:P-loop containing nucleoside triphosphate hydrolase protein, partial [Mycena capillaripes]
FHGRQSELNNLILLLLDPPARAVILGPGGMGKTTLARTVLHDSAIIEKYNHRLFISCESANTNEDLVSIIGSYLGLGPSRKLSRAIVQHFEGCGPCLLILDNFETPWEPVETRGAVEEFISLLADVPSLALLLTMRGAERPAKVKWNRPFLAPLEPISVSASRQIFSDVADEPGVGEESARDELLELCGSLPLAVSLMASIVSLEGYPSTLSRWKDEATALLSEGLDKRSNLETSIELSLGSPRISSFPYAKDLLRLLSLLPDGITEVDLHTSKIPIPDIAHHRSLLLRTSLAYMDVNKRLKTLSPIREYVRRVYPPPSSIYRPLQAHFHRLLAVSASYTQLSRGDLLPRISSHLGNINDLILQSLINDKSALSEIGFSILELNSISITMMKGSSPLIQMLPYLINLTGDSRLRWRYACEYLRGAASPLVAQDAECLITQGVEYFNTVQCPIQEGMNIHYYCFKQLNIFQPLCFTTQLHFITRQGIFSKPQPSTILPCLWEQRQEISARFSFHWIQHADSATDDATAKE